jgi:hypothetical protein
MIFPVLAGRARVFGLLVFAAACSRAEVSNPSPGPAPRAGGAGSSVSSGASKDEDTVRSVYPWAAPVDDRAVRLCKTLHDLPQNRRAQCQHSTPGVLFTGECVRALSTALSSGAVALFDTEVDACAAAMERELAGCGWARSPGPETPLACEGILHGLLPEGSRCRSSLECADGLRCHGVGPTRAGHCGPPHGEGSACGGSVDALAAYARQDHYEWHHRECYGVCNRRSCGPMAASFVKSGRERPEQ